MVSIVKITGPLVVAACLISCVRTETPKPGDPEGPEVQDTDVPSDTGQPHIPPLPCFASLCWTPPVSMPIHAGRVLAAGDLQGDGYDDLVIAAPGLPPQEVGGQLWVVHGGPSLGQGIAPTSHWTSAKHMHLGERAYITDDVTGDGVRDLFVANVDFLLNGPRGFVIEGPLDTDGTVDLAHSAAFADQEYVVDFRPWPDTNGDGRSEALVLWRESIGHDVPHHRLGVFETPLPDMMYAGQEDFGAIAQTLPLVGLSEAQDVDGDGIPEILVASSNDGVEVRVLSLEPGSVLDIEEIPPIWATSEGPPLSVGIGGDWDGDGHLDFWVSALTDAGGTKSGTTWLLFGPLPTESQPLDEGSRIDGEAHDFLGAQVLSADLNHDGQDDLIISAPGGAHHPDRKGRVYAFLGPVDRAHLDLANADYTWEGEHPHDRFGQGLAVGDFDGDGLQDLVIGAPRGGDVAGVRPGKVYVFLGKDR